MSNSKHTRGTWEVIKSPHFIYVNAHENIAALPRFGTNRNNYMLDDEVEANAKLIAAAPVMKDGLYKAYLMLQNLANSNIHTAVMTDELRAELRNILSDATGIDCEELQLEIEKAAIKKATE